MASTGAPVPKKSFRPARQLPIPLEVTALRPTHALFRDRPHTRQFLTLLLLNRGSGVHRMDGEAVAVRVGEVLLLSPQLVYDGRQVQGAEGWLVVFELSAVVTSLPGVEFITDPLYESLRLIRYLVRHGNLDTPFVLSDAALTRWNFWCQEAAAELARTRQGYQEAARAYLRLMLTDVVRLGEPRLHLTPTHWPLLEGVFGYIDRHFRDPISLSDVAEHVHRSRSHLTDLVRRETGRPVLSWIHERRLAEARALLLSTPSSVEEVAAQVGYSDTTAFTRHFKRVSGMTPAAWRRAVR